MTNDQRERSMTSLPVQIKSRFSNPLRRALRVAAVLFGTLIVDAAGIPADDAKTTSPDAADVRDGEDWPIFLGPQGTSISAEAGLLESWPESGPPVLWKAKLGVGYSAPSVRGNRLVVTHRQGREEIVDCLRADNGEPVWKFRYPTSYSDPYGYNDGPRCTPLLTKDRCYTFGAEGVLLCLDLEKGTEIWRRETGKDFTVPQAFFGVGCTPILEGDLLITLVGGQPNSGVVAFNASNGRTVWEIVGRRPPDATETGEIGPSK